MEKIFALRFLSRLAFIAGGGMALLYIVVGPVTSPCSDCSVASPKALSQFIFWLGSHLSESNSSHFSFAILEQVSHFLVSTFLLTIAAALSSRPIAMRLYSAGRTRLSPLFYLVSGMPLIIWIAVLYNMNLTQRVAETSLSILPMLLIFAMSLTQWIKIGLNRRQNFAEFLFHLPASFSINISGLFLVQFLLTHDSLGGQILEQIAEKHYESIVLILTSGLLVVVAFQDICEYFANRVISEESQA